MAQDIKSIDDFLARTDFEVLKKAKKTLLKVIENLQGSQDEQEGEDAEDLESLLNFVDNFQDLSVDVYGIDENIVFDLSKDEEDEDEKIISWNDAYEWYHSLDEGEKFRIAQTLGYQGEPDFHEVIKIYPDQIAEYVIKK